MKTRFTIITLMALIIVLASSQITYAAASDGDQVYIHLKEAAEARQDELLYLLDSDLSPDVMASLRAAIQLMQQAEAVSVEDPKASMQYYLEALKYFRETWTNYLNEDDEASTNTLKKITDADSPDLVIDDELESEIKENKVRLLDKFQGKIEEKYSSFSDDIDEMVEYLPEEDSVKAQKTFQSAQKKLEKIREKLEKGDVDDAITSLDDDLENLEDDLDYLKDKNETKTVRKTEAMNERAQREKLLKERREKARKEREREKNNGKAEDPVNTDNGNSENGNNSDNGNGNPETGTNSNNVNDSNNGNNSSNDNSENENNSGNSKPNDDK